MSTFEMIAELIERGAMELSTAIKLSKEACQNGAIEKWQYEELIELAKKYL